MPDIGYSGTPLVKKLGLQSSQSVLFLQLPESLGQLTSACGFQSLQHDWPGTPNRQFDCILWFGRHRDILEECALQLFSAMKPNGFIWICWPKKTSKVPTTISEDGLREILLPTGLVDVKVCAVDQTWSGLKFVIRKELRAALV